MTILSEVVYAQDPLQLLINGRWLPSTTKQLLPVVNPGTGKRITTVPLPLKEEVSDAVLSSQNAFEKWRDIPLPERVQYLFRLKSVLEEHLEDLARINTQNHGKTVSESRGDVRRAIDNIDAGIGAAYTLMKGEHLDQIAAGIDENTVKEPLGVFAIICPFNFPIMIPFWFLPYAIVSGCTVVVKPSEVTPLPFTYAAALIQKEVKLPPGVMNLVHGAKETVEALISHPLVKGVTFVGSTPVGKQVYKLAGENGKRAIVQAGAKNAILVMPDADLTETVESCVSSFFGNAGQRCLAGANLLVAGEVQKEILRKFSTRSKALRLGYGLDESAEVGPMVSQNAKQRVLKYIDKGIAEGAELFLDGRQAHSEVFKDGYFLGPTIFDGVDHNMTIAKEEIFGPVAAVKEVANMDEAIEVINHGTNFGNAASIFTQNGKHAREFRRRVRAGNVGVNVGVVAPMAFFPFGGMRDSFYGILHGQISSIEFFTDSKVIITRW
jgi:malonate-semialdehyde dehydrogenase (acetylating)/methylmalonate-semialdehyde dehydrogenase